MRRSTGVRTLCFFFGSVGGAVVDVYILVKVLWFVITLCNVISSIFLSGRSCPSISVAHGRRRRSGHSSCVSVLIGRYNHQHIRETIANS